MSYTRRRAATQLKRASRWGASARERASEIRQALVRRGREMERWWDSDEDTDSDIKVVVGVFRLPFWDQFDELLM